MRNTLLIVIGVLLIAAIGAFVWARAVFSGDAVRTALAAQLSEALGQPVAIDGVSAGIYPRVTVNLNGVRIGEPARIHIRTLQVGTAFRALLSRRIEHGSLRLAGARIELPLPPDMLSALTRKRATEQTSAPVEIVSIDEIVLSGVEIVSGGRTLRGDVEVVPRGRGVTLRKLTLGADKTTLDATGQITDLAGPVGELTVTAGTLDFYQVLAFVTAFSSGAGLSAPPRAAAQAATPEPGRAEPAMNVAISLKADRAMLGTLTLDTLAGRARITAQALTLEPISFGVFGGRYEGTLALTPKERMLAFRGTATLSGVDVAEIQKFGGSPETITGRLSGRIDVIGRATGVASVVRSVQGTARVDVRDGIVKNLGLVRAAALATSLRPEALSALAGGGRDEPFSRLGATLDISNGAVNTNDLRLESKDVSMAAEGSAQLDGSDVNLEGRVQLSDALSQQASQTLVRYTQEQGRVTLPVTITGTARDPRVRIDVGDMAKRAIRNRATEEAGKAIQRGLERFLKK